MAKQLNILYVQAFSPIRITYGYELRSRRFVQYLRTKGQVDFMTFEKSSANTDAEYINQTFRKHHDVDSFYKPGGRLGKIYHHLPWQLSMFYSNDTQAIVQSIVEQNNYDLIFVSKLYAVYYFLNLPAKWHKKIVIDFDDILSDLYRSSYKDFIISYKNSFFLRLKEEKAMERFRRAFVCAQSAFSKINRRFHNKVGIVPNVFNVDRKNMFEPTPNKNQLLFVGTLDYAPNAEGLQWFLETVWPVAKKMYPELKLTVVGKVQNNVEQIYEKFSRFPDVKVQLNAPDVKPYYREAYACIVPLLNGSGTRLKILESYAYGRPVLTTVKGMEGLDFEDKKNIFVFNDPNVFLEGYKVLLDSKVYQKVCEDGFKVLEDKYSPAAFARIMDENWKKMVSYE